jgi:hypothetical protein
MPKKISQLKQSLMGAKRFVRWFIDGVRKTPAQRIHREQ